MAPTALGTVSGRAEPGGGVPAGGRVPRGALRRGLRGAPAIRQVRSDYCTVLGGGGVSLIAVIMLVCIIG